LTPKTGTASFRLDESALKALHEDAKKQNISVNTLLNQLVLAYANYDRPTKRFRMIKLPGSSFKHILNAATLEAIVEAGRSTGNDVPKTFIRAKWGEINLENALNYLKTTAVYTNLFEYSELIATETLTSPSRMILVLKEACFYKATCIRFLTSLESHPSFTKTRMQFHLIFHEKLLTEMLVRILTFSVNKTQKIPLVQ